MGFPLKQMAILNPFLRHCAYRLTSLGYLSPLADNADCILRFLPLWPAFKQPRIGIKSPRNAKLEG